MTKSVPFCCEELAFFQRALIEKPGIGGAAFCNIEQKDSLFLKNSLLLASWVQLKRHSR